MQMTSNYYPLTPKNSCKDNIHSLNLNNPIHNNPYNKTLLNFNHKSYNSICNGTKVNN